jgi:hypothetical protein
VAHARICRPSQCRRGQERPGAEHESREGASGD